MQKKKIIMTVGIFMILLCVLLCGMQYHREKQKTALTRYMEQLKENAVTLEEVLVAVIDSGCSLDEKYAGRISDRARSFVGTGTDVSDEYGHGSQMASLILNNTPDSVSILPLKVMEGDGFAEMEAVEAALVYARDNGADVISLSMNAVLNGGADTMTALIDEITQDGTQVIVSAGNADMDVKNLFPANVEAALVIGAANKEYSACDFSNYGKTVDFCAYGKYNDEWGTSFAAAYVASMVAEMKSYGEDNAEEVFERYAASYEKQNGQATGDGFLWLEYALTETDEKKETDGNLYLGKAAGSDYDLGGDILSLDWRNTDGDFLNEYFAFTEEAYVGKFLSSLSEQELKELEEKSSILHCLVDVSEYRYDAAAKTYIPVDRVSYDFMKYCLSQYEKQKGKMTVSSQWVSTDNETYFVMANEDKSSRFRFEISGLLRGEASDVNGMLINREGADISVTRVPIATGGMFAPQSGKMQNYLTDVTARYTTVLNSDGSVRSVVERLDLNRKNEGDNGWKFYGLSMDFSGLICTKQGYHFAPEQKVYVYGKTEEQAHSYNLSRMTDNGFVYVESKEDAPTIVPMTNNFNRLAGPLTMVTYVGLNDGSYNYNPTEMREDIAENYYKIDTIPDVYQISDQSSFNMEAGTITMNVAYYEMSGMRYYDLDTGKLAVENDVAEYVFVLAPNEYTVVADADGGTVNDYPNNGGRQGSSGFTVRYDNSDYDNIGGLVPRKDGYIFGGWYTGKNGTGEMVWYADGLAKTEYSNYWQNGIWKYEGNLTVYAYWIPSSQVHLDANWGTITDYIGGTGSTNSVKFYTEYGQNYYDNISGVNPVRDGFTFLGWYVDPLDPDNSEGNDVGRNGGVKVWDDTGKAVEGTGFWKDGVWCYEGGNVAAFARWSSNIPVTYTAYFNANGGNLYDYIHSGQWSSTTYCYTEVGKNYYDNVSQLAPKREGHNFLGWYNRIERGTKVYDSFGSVTNEGTYFKNNLWQYYGDQTFYAWWDIYNYTVQFHANGGTGSKLTMNHLRYGQTYTLTRNTPPSDGFTRTGYNFAGWNTKSDGRGTSYGNGSDFSYKPSVDGETLTLYAQWKANRYHLRFEGNGGIGTKPTLNNLSYGENYTVTENIPPSNGFARTGYSFNGWNTKSDGTGINIKNAGSFNNLTEINGATVVLYAQWIDKESPTLNDVMSTESSLVYGWTKEDILLEFMASDKGSGMKSLILYEGHGTTGNILKSDVDNVKYRVATEGICYFTVVATDNSGNTTTVYITTKIDRVTPRGEVNIDYDGYRLAVTVDKIVEECMGSEASGCKEAWIIVKGLDKDGKVLCEEKKALTHMTPGNIYTGAIYSQTFELGDVFNYESDYIQVNAYVKDYAGNELPSIGKQTIPAFVVSGHVERCLGEAEHWSSGEAGFVKVYTAAFVDTVVIEYPTDWVAMDNTLASHMYDYSQIQEREKEETDLFYIPLYAQNGEYNVIIHAFKNGREKVLVLPVVTNGSILDEIRTRLR